MASIPCEPCTKRGTRNTSVRWCVNCEESLCMESPSHEDIPKSPTYKYISKTNQNQTIVPMLFETR